MRELAMPELSQEFVEYLVENAPMLLVILIQWGYIWKRCECGDDGNAV